MTRSRDMAIRSIIGLLPDRAAILVLIKPEIAFRSADHENLILSCLLWHSARKRRGLIL